MTCVCGLPWAASSGIRECVAGSDGPKKEACCGFPDWTEETLQRAADRRPSCVTADQSPMFSSPGWVFTPSRVHFFERDPFGFRTTQPREFVRISIFSDIFSIVSPTPENIGFVFFITTILQFSFRPKTSKISVCDFLSLTLFVPRPHLHNVEGYCEGISAKGRLFEKQHFPENFRISVRRKLFGKIIPSRHL